MVKPTGSADSVYTGDHALPLVIAEAPFLKFDDTGALPPSTNESGYRLYIQGKGICQEPVNVSNTLFHTSFKDPFLDNVPRVAPSVILFEEDPEYQFLVQYSQKMNSFYAKEDWTSEDFAEVFLAAKVSAHLLHKAKLLRQIYQAGYHHFNIDPSGQLFEVKYLQSGKTETVSDLYINKYEEALIAAQRYEELAGYVKPTNDIGTAITIIQLGLAFVTAGGLIVLGTLAKAGTTIVFEGVKYDKEKRVKLWENALGEEDDYISRKGLVWDFGGVVAGAADTVLKEKIKSFLVGEISHKPHNVNYPKSIVKDFIMSAIKDFFHDKEYEDAKKKVGEAGALKLIEFRSKHLNYIPAIPYQCICRTESGVAAVGYLSEGHPVTNYVEDRIGKLRGQESKVVELVGRSYFRSFHVGNFFDRGEDDADLCDEQPSQTLVCNDEIRRGPEFEIYYNKTPSVALLFEADPEYQYLVDFVRQEKSPYLTDIPNAGQIAALVVAARVAAHLGRKAKTLHSMWGHLQHKYEEAVSAEYYYNLAVFQSRQTLIKEGSCFQWMSLWDYAYAQESKLLEAIPFGGEEESKALLETSFFDDQGYSFAMEGRNAIRAVLKMVDPPKDAPTKAEIEALVRSNLTPYRMNHLGYIPAIPYECSCNENKVYDSNGILLGDGQLGQLRIALENRARNIKYGEGYLLNYWGVQIENYSLYSLAELHATDKDLCRPPAAVASPVDIKCRYPECPRALVTFIGLMNRFGFVKRLLGHDVLTALAFPERYPQMDLWQEAWSAVVAKFFGMDESQKLFDVVDADVQKRDMRQAESSFSLVLYNQIPDMQNNVALSIMYSLFGHKQKALELLKKAEKVAGSNNNSPLFALAYYFVGDVSRARDITRARMAEIEEEKVRELRLAVIPQQKFQIERLHKMGRLHRWTESSYITQGGLLAAALYLVGDATEKKMARDILAAIQKQIPQDENSIFKPDLGIVGDDPRIGGNVGQREILDANICMVLIYLIVDCECGVPKKE